MNKMIVCTSSSCMDYLEKPSNVAILPINVHINRHNFLDGKNISINDISRQLIHAPKLPVSTSAPSEKQLLEFFLNLIKQGVNEIMVITISSFLSKTYENIQAIQTVFGNILKVHLFDSRSISHAEAVLTYEASEMLRMGKSFYEINARLEQIRNNMTMFITVDNLKTMVRTKRISAPMGFFASLFDIKPIVHTASNGKLEAYQKIRGFEESMYRVVELIAQTSEGKQGSFFTACNTINPHAERFHQVIEQFGIKNVFHAPLASVCVANVGVYALGMMFIENYQPPFVPNITETSW